MPRETPLEVAGNSVHICSPKADMLPNGSNTYQATIENKPENFKLVTITKPDGTDAQATTLARPWTMINLVSSKGTAEIKVVDANKNPVKIDVHVNYKHVPSKNKKALHSSVDLLLSDIVFSDGSGTIDTLKCRTAVGNGKCVVFLGTITGSDPPDCIKYQ